MAQWQWQRHIQGYTRLWYWIISRSPVEAVTKITSDSRFKNQKHSAAQLLREKQSECKDDLTAIKFKVTKTNKKPLENERM